MSPCHRLVVLSQWRIVGNDGCECMHGSDCIALTLVLVEVDPGLVTTGVAGIIGPFPSGPFPSGPFPSGPFPSGCSRRRRRLSSPRADARAPAQQLHRAIMGTCFLMPAGRML